MKGMKNITMFTTVLLFIYFRKTDKLSSLPNFFYYRTMYNAYTGPRAFLPHSAINLSVKTPAEVGSSTVQSSLDLSVPEGGSPYLLNPSGGGQVPTGYNSVPNANNVSSPQILDLTRTTNMIRLITNFD